MRITVTVAEDWWEKLHQIAVYESFTRKDEISVVDLIRESLQKTYKLDKINLKLDVKMNGDEKSIKMLEDIKKNLKDKNYEN